MITIDNTRGLFLLLLSMLAGFLVPNLSCQVQRKLRSSMLTRYIVLFCLIYFMVDSTDVKRESPLSQLKETAFMITLFILFNRMDFEFTALVFFGLTALLFLDNWKKYRESQYSSKEESKVLVEKREMIYQLERWKHWVRYGIFGILIIGVSKYATRKMQTKRDFSIITFIFGNPKCSRS